MDSRDNVAADRSFLTGDLTKDGLVLWSLSLPSGRDLWCLVFSMPTGFYLVVDHDPFGDGPLLISEPCGDIGTLVDRAERVKAAFVGAGAKESERDD